MWKLAAVLWAGANAASITGFNLKSCGQVYCIQMKASSAAVASIAPGYASARAEIWIMHKGSGKVTEKIKGEDVVYDPVAAKVFIGKLTGDPKRQAYYDLVRERLFYLELNP